VETNLSQEDIRQIVESSHPAPQTVLGPHVAENNLSIRAFLPQAEQVTVLQEGARNGTKYRMHRLHPEGLFEAVVPAASAAFRYRLSVLDKTGHSFTCHDPYAQSCAHFSPEDGHLFTQGRHYRLYDKLGAHPTVRDGTAGIRFALWAPEVQRVSVVGTFNQWDGRLHPMMLHQAYGVWEIFIPDIGPGELYKYEIKTREGQVFLKTDPFAFQTESYPATAAVIYAFGEHEHWQDGEWMAQRTSTWDTPGSIYRIDLAAWQRASQDSQPTYNALAETIIAEHKNKAFDYVELTLPALPASEVISYYAPPAQYGRPEDFMALVNICHCNHIGVIVNWIPAHFPETAEEFVWFNGTRLYEYEDPDTELLLFDHRKPEVRNFLIANTLFWAERYHIDGLRTDALAANLYLDYIAAEHDAFVPVKMLVRNDTVEPTLNTADIAAITEARHNDPHAVLGPHRHNNAIVIRAFQPRTEQLYLRRAAYPEIIYQMDKIHELGLYETIIPARAPFKYRFHAVNDQGSVYSFDDPYAITTTSLTEQDFTLFTAGKHYQMFDKLGAHPRQFGDIAGVEFVVWAPNARRVSVAGDFNLWDGRRHTMRLLDPCGLWQLFIPGLGEGELYQYEIRSQQDTIFLKSDPFAFYTEMPPQTASVVYQIDGKYRWQDDAWMQNRATSRVWQQPVAIYEIHMGSWLKKADGSFLNYRELADKLVPYVKDMGFTHIELMPIAEHPYGPSWGYQISNFYAPTARYGKPADFMAFVDACHRHGIGVILDWVPAHFPKDAHAMAWFDGTCLYEHADPRKGEHPDWGTLIFNYSRHEVANFLIANALFWLEKYHIDGLRVDAVASMLYLDYSREYNNWIPNANGGNENLDAIEFVRHTNTIVHQKNPGVMMIAEESTAWPNVSRPIDSGGLGFGFKWNMGWMHDVLFYMSKIPVYRQHHHNNLTFGLTYAFSENFILSLSHDEVVHMKKSLINKMPGDEWEQFANLRLLYLFMYGHPGKKLLFMGGEFGQRNEWNHATALEWELLEAKPHHALQRFMRDLNRLYRSERAFYEVDFKGVGFEWLDVDNAAANVIAFIRKARDPRNCLVFVLNFAAAPHKTYRMGVPFPVTYAELLNSDAKEYGGNGAMLPPRGVKAEEKAWGRYEFSLSLSLPALGGIVLKPLPPVLDSV